MGLSKKIGIGGGVAVATLAALAVIGASLSKSEVPQTSVPEQDDQELQGQAISAGESFTPKEERMIIISGVTEVDPGGYVVYPFTTPKDGTSLQLVGEFSSPGGIKVFVADRIILDQFKEGKRLFFHGNFYYRTSNDTSRAPVESGIIEAGYWSGTGETLYLVFDNTEDPIGNKRVDANLSLLYTSYVRR